MVIKRHCVYTLTYDTEVMFQLQCKLCCLLVGLLKTMWSSPKQKNRERPFIHILFLCSECVCLLAKRSGQDSLIAITTTCAHKR